MRRFFLIAVILPLLTLPVCASRVKEKPPVKEGWMDDDTFRALGIGRSGPSDPTGSRACMAGMMMAQTVILDKLADAGAASVRGKVTTTYKPAFRKEFSGTLKNPRIVSQKYYPDRRECEVIVEIREKGLRKKVIEAALKAQGK